MTLGFSTQINGKPTYFPEKIWKGFHELNPKAVDFEFTNYLNKGYIFSNIIHRKSKSHTIREDKNDRWKAGKDIHMVINNRTKNRFQFAPVVKCTGVQKIDIRHKKNARNIGFEAPVRKIVFIDGREFFDSNWLNPFDWDGIRNLAKNDGFYSVDDFFNYFNSDFTGKIIHWTDLKY